jgi:hypothetical protein
LTQANHIQDLLQEGAELTQEQAQIIHLINGHVVLQDQFNQLTKHCELIYERLSKLEKLVQSMVLS